MSKAPVVAILLLLVIAGGILWQVGASELANVSLRDDLQDMSTQLGTHIGLTPPPSDDDMTQAVIRKAREHGIDLQPDQVTVQRIGEGPKSTFFLAADYNRTVNLLFFSFRLHFTPSSKR